MSKRLAPYLKYLVDGLHRPDGSVQGAMVSLQPGPILLKNLSRSGMLSLISTTVGLRTRLRRPKQCSK
ncbi:hypothetical protein H0H93_012456 [Arthromyces matolae]|nr:hypothetical protein H0H93_012456 [Arthromyces matolae]